MTLGQLRRLVNESTLADDAPVLVPADDHSYRLASAQLVPAVNCEDEWSEESGDALNYDEKLVDALIIH